MRFSVLPFLFLFFHSSWSSESSFTPRPIHPKLGEDVLLACTLTAPNGYRFNAIVPDLTTSNVGYQFNFDDIRSKFEDSRYNGYTIKDTESISLQGYIFISSLNESDLSINFTCLQTLFENDRLISVSLILDQFVLPLPDTSNPIDSQTDVSTPDLPTLNSDDTPIHTTSKSMYPTETTSKNINNGSSSSNASFTWLWVFLGVFVPIVVIVFVSIVLSLIYYNNNIRYNRRKYNVVNPDSTPFTRIDVVNNDALSVDSDPCALFDVNSDALSVDSDPCARIDVVNSDALNVDSDPCARIDVSNDALKKNVDARALFANREDYVNRDMLKSNVIVTQTSQINLSNLQNCSSFSTLLWSLFTGYFSRPSKNPNQDVSNPHQYYSDYGSSNHLRRRKKSGNSKK